MVSRRSDYVEEQDWDKVYRLRVPYCMCVDIVRVDYICVDL